MHRYRVAYSYRSSVTGKTESSVRKVEVAHDNLGPKARDAIADVLRQSHFSPTVEGDGVVVLSACLGLSPAVKELEWYAPVEVDPEPTSDAVVTEEAEAETAAPPKEKETKEPVKKTPVKHTKKKTAEKKKRSRSGW